MNTQEIFNRVVNHIREQGTRRQCNWSNQSFPYVNRDNPCQRCAKGILMDAIHAQEMWDSKENKFGWRKEVEYYLNRELDQREILVLTSLEYLFETFHPLSKPHALEQGFQSIAVGFDLQVPEIKVKKEVKTHEKIS